MVNKTIHNVLSNARLTQKDVELLEEYVSKFPHSSLVHLLALKAYHSSDKILFEEKVMDYAFKINNREVLYSLIHAQVDKASSSRNDQTKKTNLDFTKTYQLKEEVSTTHTEESISKVAQSLNQKSSPRKKEKSVKQQTVGRQSIKLSFTDWMQQYEQNNKAAQGSASFYSAEKMVDISNVDSGEVISETLANIYFHQKKYDKALYYYQKLSLLFPEKKGYFAQKIQEIKKIKSS